MQRTQIIPRFVTTVIRGILHVLCRIDARELEKLPRRGPYLIVVNHVNFLEVPILHIFIQRRVQPRRACSFIKSETWSNPFLRYLAGIWHAIPLRRGAADLSAFQAAREVFRRGDILMIAPEGTRTGNGVLRRGHPGAVLLATKNDVPIYPVAHLGGHRLYENLRRLRRTPFTLSVGAPFYVEVPENGTLRRSLRREVTDEMMGRLAVLLPPVYRGEYRAAAENEPRHLRFDLDPSKKGKKYSTNRVTDIILTKVKL